MSRCLKNYNFFSKIMKQILYYIFSNKRKISNIKNAFFFVLIVITIIFFFDNKNIYFSLNIPKPNNELKKSLKWKNQTINLYEIRKEIKSYINFNNSFIINNKTYERVDPKISIIITLYNQEKFILQIYSCILKQSFQDIEIIFVDDNSQDDSHNLIKKLQKTDKRIIYIRNSINKGQFFGRNKGVLYSKGKYVLIIDPDDLLLNEILSKTYETAEYFNLDIVQYYHMIGSFKKNRLAKIEVFGISYKPHVKEVFLNCSERFLWDKLIKRKIFIKSLKFMKKKYRNIRFTIHNDETACFGVFRVAYSYGLLEQIGYFWNRLVSNSTSKQNYVLANINNRFFSIFTTMDYYYEQTDCNKYEKVNGGYKFFIMRIYRYENRIKYLTRGFKYIIKIIDKYINSHYFDMYQKNKLKTFQNKIYLQKLKINHKDND